MGIQKLLIGKTTKIEIGFTSSVFVAGFIGVVVLPFYLYLFGAGVFWEFLGVAVSLILVWNLESYKLMRYARKNKKILTVPGYFEHRFKSHSYMTRTLAAVESSILSIVIASFLIKELAFVLNIITGVRQTALIAIIVLVVCCGIGIFGMNFISKVSIIKATLLTMGLLVVALYMYFSVGRVELVKNLMATDIMGSVSEYLDVRFHNGELLKATDVVSLASIGLLASGMPFMLGLFFFEKDAKAINHGKMIMIVFLLILFVSAAFLGAVSRGYLYPQDITNSLSGYIYMVFHSIRENGNGGIVVSIVFLVIIIAGFMTAIEGAFHAVCTAIYEDIIVEGRLFVAKKRNQYRDIIISLCISGIAIFLLAAYINSSDISVTIVFIAALGCSFSPTLVMSLFWKRMNTAGCVAGLISGMVCVPFFKYADVFMVMGDKLTLCDVMGVNSVLPSMACTYLMIILVSLFTPKPQEDVINEFNDVRNRITE